MPYRKKDVIDAFSRSPDYYDRYAGLQKETAARMARALEPWQYSLPEGPVLEVGAGTGFFTEHMVKMYPGREMVISDASEKMVQYSREKFSGREKLNFSVIDVEDQEWEPETYALIAGNFVAQWLKNPGEVMSRMTQSLLPGGFMLMSFPGSESFPQWRKYCLDLGIPYTANTLPDIEEMVVKLSMGPVKVDYYEDQSHEEYESVFDFFRHLKMSGTSTSFSGKKLKPKQLKLLNDYWLKKNNGKVTVHYHTAFVAVKRDL